MRLWITSKVFTLVLFTTLATVHTGSDRNTQSLSCLCNLFSGWRRLLESAKTVHGL
jgi:hypothetical protein